MRKKILSVYAVAMLLGILTGLLGSCFQLAIRGVDHMLVIWFQHAAEKNWHLGLLSAAVSTILVAIAWLMVACIAPEASGSGVPEIEGELLHERAIYWQRLLPVKFIGGVFAISAKMVLGREGPTIQMGGNLGEMLGKFFGFKQKRCDLMIAAGAAAGLATAFNAPLAGILFVLEEMRKELNFSFINFKTVAFSCIFATLVLNVLIGAQPAIHMAVYNLPSLQSLWLFPIFGIVVGFAGLVYNILLVKSLGWSGKLDNKSRFTLVILVGGFVGYFAVSYPAVVGGGYEIIEQALTMTPSLAVLVILFALRFIASLICYNTGVPGGIFAPMLALGTLLGLAVWQLFNLLDIDMSVEPAVFAVAGMGAFFAASVRSPLTGIILVVEMTQNYNLILPLMLTCLTSTTVVQLARNLPIYEQLLGLKRRNTSKVAKVAR